MKKIILLAAITIAALQADAQSVTLYQDSVYNRQYCNLQPFLFRCIDNDSVRSLSIAYFDNGTTCIIYYKLIGNVGVHYESNTTLTGADYAAWANDSYLYNYVANKLRLTIEN